MNNLDVANLRVIGRPTLLVTCDKLKYVPLKKICESMNNCVRLCYSSKRDEEIA